MKVDCVRENGKALSKIVSKLVCLHVIYAFFTDITCFERNVMIGRLLT